MKKNKGFTLIELMIVVVIIGILAAIAYPSYQGAVRDARRGMAQGDLLALAGFMERYYTTNSSYTGATTPTYLSESPQNGTNKYYNLPNPVISASGARFSLSAAPKNSQSDDYCGILTFDFAGTKGVSGALGGLTADDCW